MVAVLVDVFLFCFCCHGGLLMQRNPAGHELMQCKMQCMHVVADVFSLLAASSTSKQTCQGVHTKGTWVDQIDGWMHECMNE